MTRDEKRPLKRVTVLGVGNVLLRDEGFGVHVVHKLQEMDLPEWVEVVDGGTAGLDIIHMIEGAERLIVIDVVDTGGKPGELYRFTPEDLGEYETGFRTSLHDVSLVEALEMAAQLGKRPPTVVIGVQPQDMSWGLEPTAQLQAKIPEVIELVLEELGLQG